VAALVSACAVGPQYVRPAVDTPDAYKESAGMEGWTVAHPVDQVDPGQWWEVFHDPQLSKLEGQVEISNQNVRAAQAQYQRAVAEIAAARAAYLPTVSAGVSAERSAQSANVGTRQSPSTPGVAFDTRPVDERSLSATVSWEADVWGRLRRTTESSVAGAQASAADLADARLSAQVQLAQSYFQLRQVDAQRDLLERTVVAYRKSVELTTNRYAAGVATRADVAQAQSLLKTTQAQAIDVGIQRALLEHAIALLVGTAPSTFSIGASPLAADVPAIPELGVPSQLLERRPDIAAAERRVVAANAQIGVAEAAFFPSLLLSATAGFGATNMEKWLAAPSLFWSIGPALAGTLFDGGARQAQVAEARADYQQNVAQYRQSVLLGFQEVEDDLAQLRLLAQEADAEDAALQAAKETLSVVTNQYKAGTASYLDVVTAQTATLAAERNVISILGNRMSTSALLIGALGGGWSDGLNRGVPGLSPARPR
jgi:NodT family efflux transporter outer membrane factor (OMF) lipoprotein